MRNRGPFTAVEQQNLDDTWTEGGTGFYIPDYQRSFVWGNDCKIFFDDVVEGMNEFVRKGSYSTFIGNIITFDDTRYESFGSRRTGLPERVYAVVDGQQRLTTLMASIVFLHERITALARSCKCKWLKEEISKEALHKLQRTFEIERGSGPWPYYPKMIRMLDDQWSTDPVRAKYASPISALVNSYGKFFRAKLDRKPISIKSIIINEHLKPIQNIIRKICSNKSVPALNDFASENHVIKLICNAEQLDKTADLEDNNQRELLNALFLTSYLLKEVYFTFLVSDSEKQSFDIFEKLNTTGQPLTALETLKPDVRIFEGSAYKESISRGYFDEIDAYVAFKPGTSETPETSLRRLKKSSEIVIHFSLAEKGLKRSSRLTDQRQFLKESFREARYDAALCAMREKMGADVNDETAEDEANKAADASASAIVSTNPNNHAVNASIDAGREYMQFLSSFATFMGAGWDGAFMKGGWKRKNEALDDEQKQSLEEVQLCLKYLKASRHSITLPLLTRFFFDYHKGSAGLDDLLGVIKATAAFHALWRATREGTESIDDYHRLLFEAKKPTRKKSAAFLQLSRNAGTVADLSKVKAAFRHFLETHDKGDKLKIKNFKQFKEAVRKTPMYGDQSHTAKLLLLVAHHDAVPDPKSPGKLKDARQGSENMLNGEKWDESSYETVEHIIPQNPVDPKDMLGEELHCLGNLTLLSKSANSILSNKPWPAAQIVYKIISTVEKDEIKLQLEKNMTKLSRAGLKLSDSAIDTLRKMPATPMVKALTHKTFQEKHIMNRSDNLCKRTWDILYKKWLN